MVRDMMERNNGPPSLRKSSPLDSWMLASVLNLPLSSGLISGAKAPSLRGLETLPTHLFTKFSLQLCHQGFISDANITRTSSRGSPQNVEQRFYLLSSKWRTGVKKLICWIIMEIYSVWVREGGQTWLRLKILISVHLQFRRVVIEILKASSLLSPGEGVLTM